MQKFLYVYILKCSDGTYYTGVTNNPERRFRQHCEGLNPGSYTFSRRPLEIVYIEQFTDFNLAIEWEKRLKKWSHKKKEALIKNNPNDLKRFSECKNETHHKYFKRENQKCREEPLDYARGDS